MNAILQTMLVLVALAGAPIGYIFYEAAISPQSWIYNGGSLSNWAVYNGAPGPLLGAGLPLLLMVGAGAYWLARRRHHS